MLLGVNPGATSYTPEPKLRGNLDLFYITNTYLFSGPQKITLWEFIGSLLFLKASQYWQIPNIIGYILISTISQYQSGAIQKYSIMALSQISLLADTH